MTERSLTPNITVTIGHHTRIYFAFVTTAPIELDSPATVTLHAATFTDVVSFAAEPTHVDHHEQHRPDRCGTCRASLTQGKTTGAMTRHHVYALPEIRPVVTEHQCLEVECPACGSRTCAELPAGVPTGRFGPSVQAMTALLRGELRQSVRQTSAVMTQLLHVPMSTGAVAKTQEQVSRALAAPHQEALAHAQRSDRAFADETGWRQDKKKAWLWVAVTALVTVFLVRVNRSALSAKALLGETFCDLLITNR